MRRAVTAFSAIESGHYDNVITVDSDDEPGQVLRSLDKMQTTLRVRIETDRRTLAENTRVRQALDSAGTIVVVVDETHTIVYANETARKTFTNLEEDIRRDLPNFSSAAMVGASVEMFKPERALDRATLSSLSATQNRVLTRGGHTLVLNATPIVDGSGTRRGTVLEWLDRTATVAVEVWMRPWDSVFGTR